MQLQFTQVDYWVCRRPNFSYFEICYETSSIIYMGMSLMMAEGRNL